MYVVGKYKAHRSSQVFFVVHVPIRVVEMHACVSSFSSSSSSSPQCCGLCRFVPFFFFFFNLCRCGGVLSGLLGVSCPVGRRARSFSLLPPATKPPLHPYQASVACVLFCLPSRSRRCRHPPSCLCVFRPPSYLGFDASPAARLSSSAGRLPADQGDADERGESDAP